MSPGKEKLRRPNQLELLFYRDLLAPLQAFAASRWTDPSRIQEIKLLRQRFKREISRYGYVLTERGIMVWVEPDIIDSKLDADHHAMLARDMKILNRLTDKMNMALATDASARASNDCAAGSGEISAAGLVMAGIPTEGFRRRPRSRDACSRCHM